MNHLLNVYILLLLSDGVLWTLPHFWTKILRRHSFLRIYNCVLQEVK